MSAISLIGICLVLSILLLFLGVALEPLKRLILSRSGGRNQLALVPAISNAVRGQRAAYDPLEQSSWHKSIRVHIRYLARYVHVPPDLDEVGVPVELHRHMQDLAILQDLFRTGQLQRTTVTASVPDLDHDPDHSR
ncbi:uncharacterized protein LOC108138402 [Drosophila elegans]|uniref:uncharacterized protein LOC108138402 n=1 Tax=Drosophila elegans TaxID=30023 RepID=UPI0007E712D9|nr:uncharacterized protein LOC108138402 [Drosophila elegans]